MSVTYAAGDGDGRPFHVYIRRVFTEANEAAAGLVSAGIATAAEIRHIIGAYREGPPRR